MLEHWVHSYLNNVNGVVDLFSEYDSNFIMQGIKLFLIPPVVFQYFSSFPVLFHKVLPCHTGWVKSLVCVANSELLLSSAYDGTVRSWGYWLTYIKVIKSEVRYEELLSWFSARYFHAFRFIRYFHAL